jgi:hypothetical protein
MEREVVDHLQGSEIARGIEGWRPRFPMHATADIRMK